ncbi:protein of unknown function (plasmid) [Methylocella tundrae]|uniref:Uncharacterized protein n=1 Tax=Methylocella tundrae TaxID=227605 RepID=A0A4U8Z6T5_METTU|nr:protein of unknown function [Methylocella tundrae]
MRPFRWLKPSGLSLGGGCEILLNCDAVQAHAETYMGLVEVGVGLIPGWGGCEMPSAGLRSAACQARCRRSPAFSRSSAWRACQISDRGEGVLVPEVDGRRYDEPVSPAC